MTNITWMQQSSFKTPANFWIHVWVLVHSSVSPLSLFLSLTGRLCWAWEHAFLFVSRIRANAWEGLLIHTHTHTFSCLCGPSGFWETVRKNRNNPETRSLHQVWFYWVFILNNVLFLFQCHDNVCVCICVCVCLFAGPWRPLNLCSAQ